MKILASMMVAGAVMMTAVSRCVISTCAIFTYAAITEPETCAMPLVMMVNSSDSVSPREERPDGERRFGLAHEDAGRHVERFGAARAHHLLHHDGHAAHHPLHDAQVVENGEKRGDEDDDGQHLEGEDHAEAVRVFEPSGPKTNSLPASE